MNLAIIAVVTAMSGALGGMLAAIGEGSGGASARPEPV